MKTRILLFTISALTLPPQYGGFAKRILAASYLSQLKGGGGGRIVLILQPNFWTDDALRREVDEEMKRSIEDYGWTSGLDTKVAFSG